MIESLLLLAFALVALFFTAKEECTHEHKANFYSRNQQMCIDCGKLFTLEDKK